MHSLSFLQKLSELHPNAQVLFDEAADSRTMGYTDMYHFVPLDYHNTPLYPHELHSYPQGLRFPYSKVSVRACLSQFPAA